MINEHNWLKWAPAEYSLCDEWHNLQTWFILLLRTSEQLLAKNTTEGLCVRSAHSSLSRMALHILERKLTMELGSGIRGSFVGSNRSQTHENWCRHLFPSPDQFPPKSVWCPWCRKWLQYVSNWSHHPRKLYSPSKDLNQTFLHRVFRLELRICHLWNTFVAFCIILLTGSENWSILMSVALGFSSIIFKLPIHTSYFQSAKLINWYLETPLAMRRVNNLVGYYLQV